MTCQCKCERDKAWDRYWATKTALEAAHPSETRTLVKRCLLPKRDPETKRWFWLRTVRIEQHSFFGMCDAYFQAPEVHIMFPVLKWCTDRIRLARQVA